MERKRIRKNRYKKNRQETRVLGFRFLLGLFGGFGLLVLTSAGFIYCHDFILKPGFFKAKHLAVMGTNKLTKSEVLARAGISPGINILSINLSVARKRLLAHSWIEEAEIKREIPDGIRITIKEHKPMAVVDLGKKYLMNQKGMLFIKNAKSSNLRLPMISGLKYSDLRLCPYGTPCKSVQGSSKGRGRNSEHRPMDAVMEVLNLGLSPSSTIPNRLVKHIRVDRKTGLTIYAFKKAKTIKLGYHDYPEKYAALKNIMTRMKEKKMKAFTDFDAIDLNNLNRIVVKPKRKKIQS